MEPYFAPMRYSIEELKSIRSMYTGRVKFSVQGIPDVYEAVGDIVVVINGRRNTFPKSMLTEP